MLENPQSFQANLLAWPLLYFKVMNLTRQHKRIVLNNYSPIPLNERTVRYHASHDRNEHDGRILSLSRGGLFVRTSVLPERGSMVFLGFQVGKRRIKCTGKVVYVQDQHQAERAQGFGVRFVRILEDDFRHLNQIIENYYARNPIHNLPVSSN